MATKQLILFKIAGEYFGVDIGIVKEIVPYQDITPVPDAYDFVEGIINLRGKIVTTVDMRKRLQVAKTMPREKTTRIIILELDGKLMGLIVDMASEIIRIASETINPPPELISEAGAGYITGVVKHNDRLIVLLDLRRVLSAQEIGKLDDLVKNLYGDTAY